MKSNENDMRVVTSLTLIIGMIIPFAIACDGNGAGEEATIGEFRFVTLEEDNECESVCEPTVVEMCDFLRSEPELVFFARVESSDHVLEPCEERTYNSGHYEQTLKVLDVVSGSPDHPTMDVVRPSPSNGAATDVGDFAVVKLRSLDGAWLRSAVEIELGPADDVSAPDVESDDGGIIYDLPTTVPAFRQEAQAVTADYVGQCGESAERVPDDEVRSRLYDRECPDDPFPTTEDPEPGTPLDE